VSIVPFSALPSPSPERPTLTHCPICRHGHFSYQFTTEGTPIVACDGCGLLMRNPQPSDAELRSSTPVNRAPPTDWFDRIERYLGWSPAERHRRRLLDLGNGFEEASGDVCLLSNAIDRARDPMRLLDQAWRGLRPGGALLVVTDIVDRPAHWPTRSGTLNAEQLFFFDRATLESALVRAGFEQIRIVTHRRSLGGAPTVTALHALARRGTAAPIDRRRACLSVVIPVFNEKQTFSQLIDQLQRKQLRDLDLEIVIVESNSTDGTRDDVKKVERDPRVKVIWQERPRGKGNAVRTGLAQATGDFVLIQDADLEYDLDDYETLIEPLSTFRRAFVLGIRHGRDGHSWKVRHFTDQVLLGRWMNLGHLIFTALFNIVYGQRLRDPFTMFKVFRRECISGLRFECDRFDFDWELAGKLVRCGYEPREIPVNYRSRSFAEGKKVTMIRDPLTWLRACFKYRFAPLKDDRAS
jgi:SAM-dependent methyltransferase